MEIRRVTEGNALILELVGRLNSAVSMQVEKQIKLASNDKKHILLDCQELSYISSAGLRAFLSGAKAVRKQKGSLALCNLPPGVQEVFEVSGFVDILNIYGSKDRAIASFS